MSILTIEKSNTASKVEFEDYKMTVIFEDGRELTVPLEWLPKLRDASIQQLENYRFIGDGEGIPWEEMDEDILVENLF